MGSSAKVKLGMSAYQASSSWSTFAAVTWSQGAEVLAAEAPAVDQPVLAGGGLFENAFLGHVPEAPLGGGLFGARGRQYEYRRQDGAQARS